MKIALAADHRGFLLKERLRSYLIQAGHQVLDFGTISEDAVDYPDFGIKVGEAVAKGQAEEGIAICWTGNGMNIAANKVKGVRAALALNPEMAKLAREHNNANVLTLASKYITDKEAFEIVDSWLEATFKGGRHIPRLEKIQNAENA